MNVSLPDFPTYVERTEPIRQRQLQVLSIGMDDDGLEWTVRDVMEELELLLEARSTMEPEDFREEVRQQASRLLK
ncbi:hypothetical protein [Brevibacillus agri]|uniref:hypothetical protein n=1 Tax=Brevibacillus agri TaxID=51101 RepID=UPI003D25587F